MIASNLGQVIGRLKARTDPHSGRKIGPLEKKLLATMRELGAGVDAHEVLALVPEIRLHRRPMPSACIMLKRLLTRGYINRHGKRGSFTYTIRSPLGLDLLGLLP